MHARIDQLLNLRDGEPVDLAVRSHVESCTECAQAKAGIETMRRRLAALPAVDAPADGWARVRAEGRERLNMQRRPEHVQTRTCSRRLARRFSPMPDT